MIRLPAMIRVTSTKNAQSQRVEILGRPIESSIERSFALRQWVRFGEQRWVNFYERQGIRSELTQLLEDTVSGFDYEVVANLSLDLVDIVNAVDTQDMADQYVQSQSEPDDDSHRGGGTYLDRSIDDLFQRT